jgi:hypothetical protein
MPGVTYDLRVRSYSVASFSHPSAAVSYRMPGLNPHVALAAAIGGAVLFLCVFLLLGLCLVRRARRYRRRQMRQAREKHGLCWILIFSEFRLLFITGMNGSAKVTSEWTDSKYLHMNANGKG